MHFITANMVLNALLIGKFASVNAFIDLQAASQARIDAMMDQMQPALPAKTDVGKKPININASTGAPDVGGNTMAASPTRSAPSTICSFAAAYSDVAVSFDLLCGGNFNQLNSFFFSSFLPYMCSSAAAITDTIIIMKYKIFQHMC